MVILHFYRFQNRSQFILTSFVILWIDWSLIITSWDTEIISEKASPDQNKVRVLICFIYHRVRNLQYVLKYELRWFDNVWWVCKIIIVERLLDIKNVDADSILLWSTGAMLGYRITMGPRTSKVKLGQWILFGWNEWTNGTVCWNARSPCASYFQGKLEWIEVGSAWPLGHLSVCWDHIDLHIYLYLLHACS